MRRILRHSLLALLLALVVLAPAASADPLVQVPSEASLQNAFALVDDGGVIEIAAGTYASPVDGFRIFNIGKSFTVRAAQGATVVLDGGDARIVMLYRNATPTSGGPVVFENLIFRNGLSNQNAIGGGVTVDEAEATFVGCTFEDNTGNSPNTSSGAVHLTSSTAHFVDCVWRDNTATNAGAGLAMQNSTAWVHESRFVRNRTNLPNHRTTAAGGAVHLGDSTIHITNSRFEDNEAGYVGGALFGIGTFTDPISSVPVTEMTVANCTFEGNRADRDPSVSSGLPTEGGAFHAENQALGRIFYSRFLENVSDSGGGVNLYRATVEIEDSIFQGNQAVSTLASQGLGGAIAAISNDTANATTDFGAINRPSATLTVRRCLLQGRYQGVEGVAESGGGLFAAGDNNRVYGTGGVSADGTVAQNRATVVVEDSIFYDGITPLEPTSGGKGGGIFANLVDLEVRDSLFLGNDALGAQGNGQGGAVVVVNRSDATFTRGTFADNRADAFGGAALLQGSTILVDQSQFFANEISPGLSEGSAGSSPGAAIFTGPDLGRVIDVDGIVRDSIFSNQVGLPAFDDDRNGGPINEVVWNRNDFFESTFGSTVYWSGVAAGRDVPGLNSLVVNRTNGTSTDKSISANTALGSAPSLGAILAAPSAVVPVTAVGDAEGSTRSFVAWAWDGGSADLDGGNVTAIRGLEEETTAGTHTLEVDSETFQTSIAAAQAPAVQFNALPSTIAAGTSTTLEWSVTGGTFLGATIDQGIGSTTQTSGSVVVSPDLTTTYRFFLVTKEGGVVVPATVTVVEDALIFADGFESGSTGAWSSTQN